MDIKLLQKDLCGVVPFKSGAFRHEHFLSGKLGLKPGDKAILRQTVKSYCQQTVSLCMYISIISNHDPQRRSNGSQIEYSDPLQVADLGMGVGGPLRQEQAGISVLKCRTTHCLRQLHWFWRSIQRFSNADITGVTINDYQAVNDCNDIPYLLLLWFRFAELFSSIEVRRAKKFTKTECSSQMAKHIASRHQRSIWTTKGSDCVSCTYFSLMPLRGASNL